ncbi:MAG: hypothetical protein COB66_08920 [Coxiella sp. (in: Bacteria)]|nr:MAG: hypothetical protein COB66_08920 [Coxiella sp. (in: g-proteobacteria)]
MSIEFKDFRGIITMGGDSLDVAESTVDGKPLREWGFETDPGPVIWHKKATHPDLLPMTGYAPSNI